MLEHLQPPSCLLSSHVVLSESGSGPGGQLEVSSGFIRNMSESDMLIPGRHIRLKETVGQGNHCT